MRQKNARIPIIAAVVIFAMSLCLCLVVRAADQTNVAGSWVFHALGGFAAPGSAAPAATTNGISIEQNGSKIKGTLTVPRGGTSPFEGTVDGNNVHFIVKRQTPGGEVDVEYKG